MIKCIFYFFICLLFGINHIFSQTIDDGKAHRRYWYYRARMINDFMKIGKEQGACVVFAERNNGYNGVDNEFQSKVGPDQIDITNQYIMALCLEYKILSRNGQSGIVQSSHTDTINFIYHQIVDGTIGADVFGPAAMSIDLPLTDTTKWNNLYYPNMSTINECQSLGFETLYYPNYLKCIKWERKYYPGDEYTNTYWFHKKHGFIKHIGTSHTSANGGNLITITSATTSLQSVH